ncbi:MAG: molybdenum ABC transporter ATP-binding protein [Acidobacteria bacterium]|nr:MAG: molybdenum ABC transporter ATP-binding protein [Acidobacteriota bacterium]
MSVVLRDVVLPLAHFTLEVSVAMSARTTALYGPSGAGKTSVLELIAGLRKPARGSIAIHDRDVTSLPPRKRNVGYVPQDDALFPHLSVRQNITYGGDLDDAVINVLDIAHLLDRGVERLSGGERKRVALARALLSHPQVLLLDEPLAGVDTELRARVLEHLVRIRDEFPIPMVYVTHDLAEANVICEEIVMMEKGRVVRE